LAALTLGLLASASIANAARYNQKGNILIADQFNNRVIEVSPAGDILWQFGVGPNDVSAASPIGTNDALRVGGLTLISGTGAPAGTEPNCTNGCADNRVMLVNHAGKIVWQYGVFGVTGSGPDQLNTPVQATVTPQHTFLIADQGNQRIIEVNKKKQIVWQYGTTGVPGSGPDQLNNPNSAEQLDNGDILIADESNNRAIVVDRQKNILATFDIGGKASGVAFASRLPGGDTLITDSNNNRVVEVDGSDKATWKYVTNKQAGSNPNPLPTRGIRLKNGNTIISDQFNHRVIIVNHAKQIVVQYGSLNAPGFGLKSTQQGLNGPYDAKVIGDNTGLTFIEPGDAQQSTKAMDH
jgi:hypothetical protein